MNTLPACVAITWTRTKRNNGVLLRDLLLIKWSIFTSRDPLSASDTRTVYSSSYFCWNSAAMRGETEVETERSHSAWSPTCLNVGEVLLRRAPLSSALSLSFNFSLSPLTPSLCSPPLPSNRTWSPGTLVRVVCLKVILSKSHLLHYVSFHRGGCYARKRRRVQPDKLSVFGFCCSKRLTRSTMITKWLNKVMMMMQKSCPQWLWTRTTTSWTTTGMDLLFICLSVYCLALLLLNILVHNHPHHSEFFVCETVLDN